MNTFALASALSGFFKRGRLINPSKSYYRSRHPKNFVVFDAYLCVKGTGTIWMGDLDLTIDAEALQHLAREIGQTLYVLNSPDARFENHYKPLYDNAVAQVMPTVIKDLRANPPNENLETAPGLAQLLSQLPSNVRSQRLGSPTDSVRADAYAKQLEALKARNHLLIRTLERIIANERTMIDGVSIKTIMTKCA